MYAVVLDGIPGVALEMNKMSSAHNVASCMADSKSLLLKDCKLVDALHDSSTKERVYANYHSLACRVRKNHVGS